jgi:hypothetical protein
MTNLLAETLEAMKGQDLTPTDVSWVGSRDGCFGISWDEFAAIANVEYHSDYGAQEVAPDLVVVFGQGRWLERREYDGAEWWEYKTQPILQSRSRRFSRVTGGMWDSLAELESKAAED